MQLPVVFWTSLLVRWNSVKFSLQLKSSKNLRISCSEKLEFRQTLFRLCGIWRLHEASKGVLLRQTFKDAVSGTCCNPKTAQLTLIEIRRETSNFSVSTLFHYLIKLEDILMKKVSFCRKATTKASRSGTIQIDAFAGVSSELGRNVP